MGEALVLAFLIEKLLVKWSLYYFICICLLSWFRCFPLFALMQKVEQKDQGQPEGLRPFGRPAHGNSLLI
jgi:hypothetical protein